MFAHCPVDTVIPSLTFTKAELVYVLGILLKDVDAIDNSTQIEMVEVRHYMNQIKDRVNMAIADGTVKRVLAHSETKAMDDAPTKPQEPVAPSMAELRQKFPNLTEEEIRDILERARAEQRKKAEEERKNAPPPPPSFIAKPEEAEEGKPIDKPVLTPQAKKDRENSKKFAQMLGAM